jgi:hypothetical protein
MASVMFMQIFVNLFIGGFVTAAAIGHIALLHALRAPATEDADWTDDCLFPGEQRRLHAVGRVPDITAAR